MNENNHIFFVQFAYIEECLFCYLLVEFELVRVVAGHDGEGGRQVLGVPTHEGDAEEPVPVGVARRRTMALVGHNT
jgi:hypothetical protein